MRRRQRRPTLQTVPLMITAGIDVTALVIDLASQGYAWVLTANQRDLLRGLGASAFDNSRSFQAMIVAGLLLGGRKEAGSPSVRRTG